MLYDAYFHSIMGYVIIFWENSPVSRKVFQLQKKIIRIMRSSTSRTSCKSLFRTLEILTMPSEYVLSLTSLFINNLEYFTFKFSIGEINTRRRVLTISLSYMSEGYILYTHKDLCCITYIQGVTGGMDQTSGECSLC